MPSGETPPSQNLNQSRLTQSGTRVEHEVKQNLVLSADDSPLDFLRNNTRPPLPPAQPNVDPQSLANNIAVQKKLTELDEAKRAVQDIAASQSESAPAHNNNQTANPVENVKKPQPDSGTEVQKPPSQTPEEKFDPLKLLHDSLKKDKALTTDPSSDESQDKSLETTGDVSLEDDSKEVNFKKLREAVKETKKTLQEKEALLKDTSAQLERYKTGEVMPETLQKQQNRIAELEKFEKIVSLKTSPEYQDKYIKPLDSITKKLDVIAADYKIPPEMLKESISFKSQAELNSFLSENFDGVGALEVKQLITQARELKDNAIAAENDPNISLTNLIEEGRRAETVKKQQQRSLIADQSRSAWVESLSQVRKEGKILELIPKDNDDEYNEKYINPILTAASEEYGKLVTMLAENGLTQLPKDIAYALSRLTQLAHASALSIEGRDKALRESEALKKNTTRDTKYLRPQFGSSFGRGGDSASPAPSSPKGAADALLASIGVGIK